MKNPFETAPEFIPTKEEVLGVIKRHAENASFVRELSDSSGLYLLEAKAGGERSGEFIEYLYLRKGEFPNQNATAATHINVVYYEDGVPVGGSNISNYNEQTGQWEDVK
jgi:hypothetical protein